VGLYIQGLLLRAVSLLVFEGGWRRGCWLVVVGFGMRVRLVVRVVDLVVGVRGLWLEIGRAIYLEV
jgi:hypothetical protein